MSTSKGEVVSRLRGLVKGENQDSFLTDKFLYSLVLKYAKLFIKRLDDQNKIGRYEGLYEPFAAELIEVSASEASCASLATCCTFRRTKDKLPKLLTGTWGPIIRTVSSVDGSIEVRKTQSSVFTDIANTTTFKYNKNKYYWLSNGYAYFPNLEWEEVLIDGMFEDSIKPYECCVDDCCIVRQSEPSHIPDFLFADIEQPVRAELLNMIQIPKDSFSDNQSLIRP